MRRGVRRGIGIGLAWVLLSCGGAETDASPDDGTGGGEATADPTAVPSPPTPWDEMDHSAKQAWMYTEVLPRMEAMFQEYDAERYAGFSCETCHGPSPGERDYAMPSVSIPALPPTGSDVQHAMVRTYPEGTRFMFSRVLPTMQTLLGADEFDEATGEGFSCFACHPHEGDEGSTLIRVDSGSGSDSDSDSDS